MEASIRMIVSSINSSGIRSVRGLVGIWSFKEPMTISYHDAPGDQLGPRVLMLSLMWSLKPMIREKNLLMSVSKQWTNDPEVC